MDAQMRSLEGKGYLETDFMGNAQVKEELHKFVDAASGSTAYLCQMIQKHQQMVKVFYFFRDGAWFELEQLPEGSGYRVQEIYAWHELMFQVVTRTPLIPGLNDSEQWPNTADEVPDLELWVEQLLLAGASAGSLAEIHRTDEVTEVNRELHLLMHEEQMWLLRRGTEERVTGIPVSFATAVEEIIAWLQETQLSGEAGHVNSINNISI
jgi:hypothetical protein